ncbi:MAG: FAD-binding oxidoreductase [Deltaproteobacteria bacterium]|nr:FAD-binding oxidoreductase [Deltaproteobacteria bacterium]
MISKEAVRELEHALGAEFVSCEPAVMDGYAYQPTHAEILGLETKWCPYRPVAVVLPHTTEEVQAVVRICNAHKLQFKALSTGWGIWNAPGSDNVVQIDLRRMDKLTIDTKNMIAVMEPYVSGAQIQAEGMKSGLNVHMVGCGCHASPLASATSLMGPGCSGITTGYSPRNVLGVEWVLPDGEILRLGVPGQGNDEWFYGDGPGPSLRGIMRGTLGACGGLGVFTKCALKLFPWPGPAQPKVEGVLMDAKVEIPGTHSSFLCFLPNLSRFADAFYKISNAEIGYFMGKHAITGALLAGCMPRAYKNLVKSETVRSILTALQNTFVIILCGRTQREYDYQHKVLKQIIADCEGFMLNIGHVPLLHSMLWWGFIRNSLPPAIFRAGGRFTTAFGGFETIDQAVFQSKIGAVIKQELIDSGDMMDDLADNSWGGLYEGSSCLAHQEELAIFDPREPKQNEGVNKYIDKAMEASTKYTITPGIGFGGGGAVPHMLGPLIYNYHHWLLQIKETLDPGNSADPSFFIAPEAEKEKYLRDYARRRPQVARLVEDILAADKKRSDVP